MYEYRASLERVVDGDTVDLKIDVGFSIFFVQRFRLEGVNTPELHSTAMPERAAAQSAKDFLEKAITGQDLIVVTKKDKQEKYGRYLCTLLVGKDKTDVNAALIKQGFAVAYSGGKR